MRRLAALLLIVSLTTAQTVAVGGINFDTSKCLDVASVNSCYQAAQAHNVFWGNQCNMNYTTRADALSICLNTGFSILDETTVDCMMQFCWNQATTCSFQLAIAATYNQVIGTTNGNSIPQVPFYFDDYGDVPGSCVCNVANLNSIVQSTSNTGICLNAADQTTCQCCAYSEKISYLYAICPHNTLANIGGDDLVQSAAAYATNCAFLSSPDATASCAAQSASFSPVPSVGYLDLASLPSGFPGTAPLSNSPGSITALSQLSISDPTIAVGWGVVTTTVVLETNDAAGGTPTSMLVQATSAATSSGPIGSITSISLSPVVGGGVVATASSAAPSLASTASVGSSTSGIASTTNAIVSSAGTSLASAGTTSGSMTTASAKSSGVRQHSSAMAKYVGLTMVGLVMLNLL